VPTSRWIAAAVSLAAAGIVAGAATFWLYFRAIETEMIRIVMPDTAIVKFDRPGRYGLFLELRGIIEGEPYALDAASGLHISIVDETTGNKVPLLMPFGGGYSTTQRRGIQIHAFAVDQPGSYAIGASYRDGSLSLKLVMAIGRGIVGDFFWTYVMAICIAVGGSLLAVVVVIVADRRRSKLVASKGTTS
jgi:hypothetical protein